uniref:alpha,alpha-trehalose-phosphate synthase (UDP-forming) n=2 Tax=Parascaris univalens TaxID=6257 RepID=A0A914ZRG6_PARUN
MAANGNETRNNTEKADGTTEDVIVRLEDQPFHRGRRSSKDVTQSAADNIGQSLVKSLKSLHMETNEDEPLEKLMEIGLDSLAQVWRKRDGQSEVAFQGLLSVLEYCLQHSIDSHAYFEHFVKALGYNTVQFWKSAVPYIFDSDLTYGTKFRDALLFSLTLFDVNNGKNKLRELYAAVPGIRKSLLGVHAKQFGEKFHHLQRRLSRQSSRSSLYGSSESLCSESSDAENECDNNKQHTMRRQSGSELNLDTTQRTDRSNVTGVRPRLRRSQSRDSTASNNRPDENTETFSSGGLANTHFQQRVINVSNAPPVSLKREKTGEWEIKQGSGGLVSCVDPVMSKDKENVWLANLGMNLHNKKHRRIAQQEAAQLAPATNTLGLPLIKQANADILFHVLADDDKPDEKEQQDEQKKAVREEMSLLGVLHNYNRGNYKLNPVIVQEDDYNVYYGGISNGLLWPALHNLPEYIVKDYDNPKTLRDHWCAYVRVNYQFAIDAVRNSRPQDFIWIHDYHLILTGLIMQSLDPNLEVGFFLHIPFQPPENFFTKFGVVGIPMIRGLLRFTKVGFQTHRDRSKFVELCKIHLPSASVAYDSNLDINTITYEGWTCSLGVFPVSIKNEDFLKFVKMPDTIKKSNDIRQRLLGESAPPDARLFFSVERFDYTKGIKEKLMAYKEYFTKYRDRIGKDVLYQVAVTNRRSVDTYRLYQDECMALAESINQEFTCPNRPKWKPLLFTTVGLPRADLVASYLAMDIGVVTPKKDGMNLVAKEMLVCNPHAGLILSTGAGSEIQFSTAGFYNEENGDQCYKRVADLYDIQAYADAFYQAATESEEVRSAHGSRLNEFIMANDIEHWSAAFLDPSWTHQVIRPLDVKTLDEFYGLMMRTRNVRRQIVERVLKGIPIRSHFAISLKNAMDSLALSCEAGKPVITLQVPSAIDTEPKVFAKFDIKNELDEFEKDLSFLKFIQSDDVYNVEQFVDTLQAYHPLSPEAFKEEVATAVELLYDADHFHYFFTDRDGTLKSYSCSYPASIQPAYSGVIQAQFARRCAQTCAIVTTSPLMHLGILDVGTIPEGYYYYGASVGREWFIDPSNKFKDKSISEDELALLDKIYEELTKLLEQPEYKLFAWVGSGLQKHYGHITVARQDVFQSVSQQLSAKLREKIQEIVRDVDPAERSFLLTESDTDIKIFLKASSGVVFNKGHGIALMIDHIHCKLSEGNILVCGDSETDLPMLEVCLGRNPLNVYTIWVTRKDALKEKVRSLCKQYGNSNVAFVSCPEVLLGAMAQATIREISIARPRHIPDIHT